MTRTIFVDANVLDGEHAPVAGATVVVEDDRITQVVTSGTSVETGPNDRVIECSGLTLMPGMTQGHFHATYHNLSLGSLPIGLEAPPAYQAYQAAYNAGLALKCGFTSLVGASEPWDIAPSLKQAIADGIVVGPRMLAGSREIINTADSTDMVPWYWQSGASANTRLCDGADEFRKAVREEVKRGAEVVKLFVTGGHAVRLAASTSTITHDELHAAVDAAHTLGRRVRAHVASRDGVLRCLDAGVDIIDHGDGIDDECIGRMAEQGVFYIPSVRSHQSLSLRTGEHNYEGRWGSIVRETCAALRKCVEAGVIVVLGDDYGGISCPHGTYGGELAFYQEFTGLDVLEIIKWATVNGGKIMGLPDLGRIREGYLADIVLVDGDPSADLNVLGDTSNIRAVMRDGQLLVDHVASADHKSPPLVDVVNT